MRLCPPRVRALTELKASEVCLGALRLVGREGQPGALRALYGIYEPAVVDGSSRVSRAQASSPGIRNALAASKSGGPYQIPEDVREALNSERTRELAVISLNSIDRLPGAQYQTLRNLLNDPNPRVRSSAISALRRLRAGDAAPHLLPLVADADPIVSHLAVRALSELKASQVCLTALDSSDDKVKPGALHALCGIYDPAVVDGLTTRLAGSKGELRRGILNALCRLANQEAPYTDPKVWWGTRPDTTGPVYQPIAWSETEKITAALKAALDHSSNDDARWLVQRMYQTKVNYPGLVELMLAKAGTGYFGATGGNSGDVSLGQYPAERSARSARSDCA
jgi:hypothetical protein